MRSMKIPRILSWIIGLMLLLLLILTVYRFIFFYQYRAADRPIPGSAFLLGLRFDLRAISVCGLFILLLSYIPLLNPFRQIKLSVFWKTILVLLFFTLLLFLGADFYHYDYLDQRLNASVLNFLEDAAISFQMMWQTYPLLKIFLALTIFSSLFFWVSKRWFTHLRVWPTTSKKVKIVWHSVFVLLLSILIFGNVGQYPLRWSDAFRFADDFKANVSLNPFQSFFSSFRFKNSTYDLKKVKEVYPLMSNYLGITNPDNANLNYTRVVNFQDTFAIKPNVIIVICESFSAYKSSMFGNKLNPTSYFNSLSQQGIFFERCFVPTFGTARGVWAIITGIPDVESPKTASRNPAAVDQHSIINDFIHYNKYYFLGGSTTWANIRGVLQNNLQNLSIFEEAHFKSKKIDVWGISDKNLFLEANTILSKERKPFFAIIQTADNHRPYTIPGEDKDEFELVTFPTDTLKKYGFEGNDELNAFRYTDFCFRKFMEAAEKAPYYKNTIFVFVGDHGLRGDAGTMFPESFTREGLAAQHVPLLFYSPALLLPGRRMDVSSQLDILPSIAHLVKQPHRNTTLGLNLFDSSRAIPRYAMIGDPDLQTIGVVGNEYYYRRHLKTGMKDFVSVTNNSVVNRSKQVDSTMKYMTVLTEAWYETAKYMLLNNKKKKVN